MPSTAATASLLNSATREERVRNKRQAAERQARAEALVESVFAKFDTDASNNLSRAQLCSLLQELNGDVAPTEEEVDYVMAVADDSDGEKNHRVDRHELVVAVEAWNKYKEHESEIASYFDKYDTDRSGVLNHDQLMQLLTDLNCGRAPSDSEVNYIMYSADRKDGKINRAINRPELMYAIGLWYALLDEDQKQFPEDRIRYRDVCTIT
mmetsp:Transcript_7756/g.14624  ORF Transcript_7756/g.14624 Transcript_7756/m.14624 type:complete len:209 (+) Transcript_7756:130-756(+)